MPQQQLHHDTRCLSVFMTFLWTTFFLATLVLHQVIDAWPGMVPKPDTDSRARMYRSKEMVSIISAIRKGDYRLVRPTPTEESLVEQVAYCPYKLNPLIMNLCTTTARNRSLGKMSVSLHKRGIAAEAIGLCLTNQPQHRDQAYNTSFLKSELNEIQQNELIGWSLAEGLYGLMEDALAHQLVANDTTSLNAISQAAETTWIASFHHPKHIQNFLELNTIELLGKIVTTLKPKEFGNDFSAPKLNWGFAPGRAVMWACAALANLAASYCDNELAHCLWDWNEEGEWVLDAESTKLEAPQLADQARAKIAAVPRLVETLVEWVCQGPISQKHNATNGTYGWPSEAIIWKDLTFNAPSPHFKSPSIVPWAAAGVIKNLLLAKENLPLMERIHSLPNLQQCLCALTQSPDWLEQSKSMEALRRWSPEGTSVCPDVYANCRDDTGWENAESGDKCRDYYEERWCVPHGEDVDTNNKTANQACCACGGGYPKEKESGDGEAESAIAAEENMTTDAGDGEEVPLEEAAMGDTPPEEHVAEASTTHEEL